MTGTDEMPPRPNGPSSGTWQVGDVTVTRIDELTLDGHTAAQLLPGADPAFVARHRDRLGPGLVRPGEAGPGSERVVVSIHTWLLRTPRHVILIDTATGNGKSRPQAPELDGLDEPYLARLAAAGVRPEDVDAVLITHLHADHVGWNTRLIDGRWQPTFPRARHYVSAAEQRYNADLADGRAPLLPAALGPRARVPYGGVYDDSVRPILDAGLAALIDVGGGEVLDGLAFVPTPGHSIDHASIRLVSRGQEALFAGDVMHHPLQVYAPELSSCFCEFPEAAEASRRAVLAEAAERGSLIFATHFAESSVGRVRRAADGYAWSFA